MEMDMDLDAVTAAKGTKRAVAAVEDLEDDEERRLEEELRTKAPKGNFWVYPPDISELLKQTRILRIRTAACLARSAKNREEFARRYYQKTPDSAAVTGSKRGFSVMC